MRAGRRYLAQRALETALPGIDSANTIMEAKLLLAEALQEQGRWRDSFDLLRSMSAICGEPRMYVDSLEARALQSLGSHFLAELQGRVPRLLAIVRKATNHRDQGSSGTGLSVLGRRCSATKNWLTQLLQDLDSRFEKA